MPAGGIVSESLSLLLTPRGMLSFSLPSSEFSDPSDEFVSLIAKEVNFGRLTQDRRKRFKKFMSRELEAVLSNVIVDYCERDNPVITTPEEIEGFYIVRAILSEKIDSGRVAIRDRQSYCAILLDDNHNYTICRLYFNDLDNLTIALFDSFKRGKNGFRVEEKLPFLKLVRFMTLWRRFWRLLVLLG